MFNGMSIKQAIGVAMVLVVALLQMPTLIYQLYTLGYTNTRFKIRTRPGFYEGHAWCAFYGRFWLNASTSPDHARALQIRLVNFSIIQQIHISSQRKYP